MSKRTEVDTIAYPFPFEHGMGKLILPRGGLTRAEADRLKEMIDSLVTQGPAPLTYEAWLDR